MKTRDCARDYVWSGQGTSFWQAVCRRGSYLRREQGGFTLMEVMVSLMLMTVVFLALHSILDMSVRSLSVAKDHDEVTSNARPAMERMEREIRAAYPVATSTGTCTATTAGTLLVPPTAPATPASKITFCNDMGSSGVNKVSYYQKTYSSSSGQTIGLYRQENDGAEEIMSVLGPASPSPTGSVVFSYYNSNNTEVSNPSTAAAYSDIYMVKITLTVRVASSGLNQSGSTQTLTSYVSLQNR